MRFTTLEDWLQWQQNAHPKAIDLGLERVAGVAQGLGLLQPKARVITVAGTNGKGSCVAALEAIFRHLGLRVGAYTSPHLLRYNERVRIDGQEVTDEALCAAFDVIDQARGDTSLSYFEFGTLAALYLFSQEPLDCWLLEVGLGGRLDATNIVDADVAVVTSIDIDHVEWLGDNRESIGREKAGIFRRGRPAICADVNVPGSVRAHADELQCEFSVLNEQFGFRRAGDQTVFWSGDEQLAPMHVNLPKPSLAAAIHVARRLGVGDAEQVRVAVDGLSLAGRMQYVSAGRQRLLLDVAHNPAAVAQLAAQIEGLPQRRKVAAVIAMMADKNLKLSLEPLRPLVDVWAFTTIEGLPRAASADVLAAALPSASVRQCYSSVSQALEQLVARAEFDIIVVTGSFYTVAEAQAWLKAREGDNETAG